MEKDDVGAMWIKTSRKGEDYLSITINGERYVAFKNDFKKKDTQPDYRIFESESQTPGEKQTVQSSILDDEIPFVRNESKERAPWERRSRE